MTDLIDKPDAVCAVQSHGCTAQMIGHGGLIAHRMVPEYLVGDREFPQRMTMCPNHSHRQHALIRYMVERVEAGQPFERDVVDHFTGVERIWAEQAIAGWQTVHGEHPEGRARGFVASAARAV